MSKRKRPGKKRSKKGNPLKWVLITGATLLLLLFIGLFTIKGAINGWLRGDGFRDWVKNKSATLLKSDVEFATLEWKNSEVYLEGFQSRGYEDAGFSKLDLDGVRVVFDGKSDDAWQIPETTVNRLNMEFSNDRLSGEFARYKEALVGTGDGKSSAPSWLKDFLPNKVDMGEITINSANVTVQNSAGEESFALRNVRATIDPDFERAVWEFKGRNGKMSLPGMPDFDLQSFSVRWQRENLYLTSLAANFMNGAFIDGTGDVVFGEETMLNLDLKLENLNLHEVIQDQETKDKVSGFVSGPIKITGAPGSEAGLKQSGTIHIKDGVLTNLDVLNTVAKYTRTEQFRRLGLNEATADFERVGDRILLTNIKIQSDGLTRIEGDLLLEGETVAGDFQLGVMPGILRWIPGADRKVFVTPRDGFVWTPLKITGTRNDIQEDLTSRLIAAAGMALIEDLPANVIEKARETTENPTAAPRDLIKEATSLFETLTPLFKP